jgi:flagellar motility protein MotE (MotC chaperone)
MAAKVRVLPAVIALAVGVLAFKGVDFAQAMAEDVEDAPATEEAPALLSAGVSLEAEGEAAAENAPPAPDPVACLPSLDYAAETGISEQEILVLRSLAERRAALDEREAGVDTREQAAMAAESRLAEQIEELKAVEAEVQKILASMETKRTERMDALVRTYESMKPKDAARIFDGMGDEVLLELAKSMKPATLAAIMSAMDSKRAEKLTLMLANLAQPPEQLESLAKTSG